MKFSIVYFSAAGHTEKVVRHIAEQLGGVDRVVDLSDKTKELWWDALSMAAEFLRLLQKDLGKFLLMPHAW